MANRDSVVVSEGTMRPNKPRTTGEAARVDWDWIDREVAPLLQRQCNY